MYAMQLDQTAKIALFARSEDNDGGRLRSASCPYIQLYTALQSDGSDADR